MLDAGEGVGCVGIRGVQRGEFFDKGGTVGEDKLVKRSRYIRCDAVKGPGWCKVRPAAAGGNMIHVSPGLKVLRGQARPPQGIKKKEASQVSEERGRGSRTRRRK